MDFYQPVRVRSYIQLSSDAYFSKTKRTQDIFLVKPRKGGWKSNELQSNKIKRLTFLSCLSSSGFLFYIVFFCLCNMLCKSMIWNTTTCTVSPHLHGRRDERNWEKRIRTSVSELNVCLSCLLSFRSNILASDIVCMFFCALLSWLDEQNWRMNGKGEYFLWKSNVVFVVPRNNASISTCSLTTKEMKLTVHWRRMMMTIDDNQA